MKNGNEIVIDKNDIEEKNSNMKGRATHYNLSIRGNDEKFHVKKFFDMVISHYKPTKLEYKIAFITVNHLVPTLPPFLEALGQIGRVALIIPKSSHRDESIFHEIEKDYLINKILKEDLNNKIKGSEVIHENIKDGELAIIIDIGGYFAPCVKELSHDQRIKGRLLGIVEDTENGHQKYEKVIKDALFPIISVARSELKETEDYNVGKSIVEAVDTILRTDAHTIIERMDRIGVIGFGKIGRSIAKHLREKKVRRIYVHDANSIIEMKASSEQFIIIDKDDLLAKSDMIFCATGNKAIANDDFKHLKDNVFIASCTSADDEFDLSLLEKISKERKVNHINEFTMENGNKINLLCRGNAVNFVFNAVNGPYIYSVQAELIVATLKLITNKFSNEKKSILELTKEEMKNIAVIWRKNFERKSEGEYHKENNLLIPAKKGGANLAGTIWNVRECTEFFVGRESKIKEINAFFELKNTSILTQAIAGAGGIGKTQLALEYANKCRSYYSGNVRWIDAETKEILEKSYCELANALDIQTKNKQINIIISEVTTSLQNYPKSLLIFDNAENYEDIKLFLPKNTIHHILITTRNQHFGVFHTHVVDIFTQEETLAYFKKTLPNLYNNDNFPYLNRLAKKLGYLPLAISQAVHYIRMTNCTVLDYITLYKNAKELLLSSGVINEEHYNKTVMTTWKISIEKIKNDFPEANILLEIIAYLNAENISNSLFNNLFNTFTMHKIVIELFKYSLITKGKLSNTFNIHRIVQEVIRIYTSSAKMENLVYNKILMLMLDNFKYDRYNANTIKNSMEILPHVTTFISRFIRVEFFNDAFINLQINVAEYYIHHLRNANEAIKILNNILKNCDKITDVNKIIISKLYNNLGFAYFVNGNYTYAKKYGEQAIHNIVNSGNEESNTQLIYGLRLIGYTYYREGHYSAAKKSFFSAIDLQMMNFRQQLNPDLAGTAHCIGHIYYKEKKYIKSYSWYKLSNQIKKNINLNLIPEITITNRALGRLKCVMHDHHDSYNLLTECYKTQLDIYKTHLHTQVADTLNELCKLFQSVKYYDAASIISATCIYIHQSLGTEISHQDFVSVIMNFLKALYFLGYRDFYVRNIRNIINNKAHIKTTEDKEDAIKIIQIHENTNQNEQVKREKSLQNFIVSSSIRNKDSRFLIHADKLDYNHINLLLKNGVRPNVIEKVNILMYIFKAALVKVELESISSLLSYDNWYEESCLTLNEANIPELKKTLDYSYITITNNKFLLSADNDNDNINKKILILLKNNLNLIADYLEQVALSEEQLIVTRYNQNFSCLFNKIGQEWLSRHRIYNLLFAQLTNNNQLLGAKGVLTIAEHGCGTGDSSALIAKILLKYHTYGVAYYAADQLPEHVELAKAKLSEVFKNTSSNAIVNLGDVIKSNAKQINMNFGLTGKKVDICICEHSLYSICHNLQAAKNHIGNILEGINPNGLFFSIMTVNSDFDKLRLRHGANNLNNQSEPSINFRLSLQELGLPVYDIPIHATLSFPQLTDEEWVNLRNGLYSLYSYPNGKSYIKEAIMLIEFMGKPIEFMRHRGELDIFIDKLRTILKNNTYLNINSVMQICPSLNSSQEFIKNLETAVGIVKDKLDQEGILPHLTIDESRNYLILPNLNPKRLRLFDILLCQNKISILESNQLFKDQMLSNNIKYINNTVETPENTDDFDIKLDDIYKKIFNLQAQNNKIHNDSILNKNDEINHESSIVKKEESIFGNLFRGMFNRPAANSRNNQLIEIARKYNLLDSSQTNLEKGLRMAATNNQVEDLRVLIGSGIDINAQDNNLQSKKTALHWAVIKQTKVCIKVLLTADAQFDIKDATGKTAYDYAKEVSDSEILTLFSTQLNSTISLSNKVR